jgi:signal transduction histidine kinase
MNIKTRLSFQFTVFVTVILLSFSILTYYFSYTSQRARFRAEILDGAKNSAILLINVAEVDSSLLKKIHQSTFSLDKEETVITDSALNPIYVNNIQYLTEKVIRVYRGHSEKNFFSINEKDGVYYKHHLNNKTYFVYVMAYDRSRVENLSELRHILYWCILFNICLSVIFSYLFSKRAIRPISRIINSVKAINSSKLSHRLDEGNRKDEIDQLAITFNEILANLEIAFKNQEDFVSYASHELRTPLTVMIVESDYVLSRERIKEEYMDHISALVIDLKLLNTLLNSLLELAQINKYNELQFLAVRLDEIVYNAIHQVKARYQNRKIIPKIQYPENENDLVINGNSGLLIIAFKNLIENACKFSNDDVSIEILILDKIIEVTISDKGIGIPPNELDIVLKPFKRASNVKFKSGFGIGLSLVNKIIGIHESVLKIYSIENEGTRVVIQCNKMYQKSAEPTNPQ